MDIHDFGSADSTPGQRVVAGISVYLGWGPLPNILGSLARGIKRMSGKFDAPNVSRVDAGDIKPKQLDGVDPKTAPSTEAANIGPVKPGQEAPFKDLKKQKRKNGETEPMDMDHRPSAAAQVKAAEVAKGEPLTKAEIAKVKAEATAVATPRKNHQRKSRTYAGRNNQAQVDADAADLEKARRLDDEAYK